MLTTDDKTLTNGSMGDGSFAPLNSDAKRLDWMGQNPGLVKNLKSGVMATKIHVWQPSLRAAIDAAMEFHRRELRSRGANPKW